jgi:type IV pilus assembly protein PilW
MNPIHIQQNPSPSARRQRGLSLVEILVALTISLFVVAGVIQLFVSSKQTYRSYDALSRIQENGRFALELMARDIRMAGHYGCLPAALITNPGAGAFRNQLNTPNAYFWNFGQPIQGFESTGAGAWTPALDASITSPFAGGNVDVLTIRSTDGPIALIDAHAGPLADPRARGTNFTACDVVVAANCAEASVFQVTGVAGALAIVGPPPIPAGQLLQHAQGGACGGAPGNSAATLGTTFNPGLGGEVAQVSTKSYYIRDGASGRPALWRVVGPDAPQELVEGVERMEIRYGICTGTGAARSVNPPYVAANAAGINWANVCSVRIDLLLASLEDNLVTTAQTVVFPADTGTTVLATDRRLRQGFSTTVGIRNRLP